MTDAAYPTMAACPACSVGDSAQALARAPVGDVTQTLSLPTIHCAACIAGVETALEALPGVHSARVNLGQKRVAVSAAPDVSATDLTAALARAGYEAHELDAEALTATATDAAGHDLLMRLGVSGFAMMNVMLLSVAVWSGAEAATRDLFHWLSAAIALPTIAFAAQPFFRSAFGSLSRGALNMDVPISLAILLAPAMSLYETWQSGQHAYFDAALSLTFFLLAGRYLDHRTRRAARSAAEELSALEVPRATRLSDGLEQSVHVGDLSPGDQILLRPGARTPVDATVLSGASEVDCALLTGETQPVPVAPGGSVAAGTINLTGPLTLRVDAAAADSTLHRLAGLVAVAERARNRYTSLADRAARMYAPGVHLLAAAAFLGWLWVSGGDVRLALNIAVAVLIITCPCALGLAVPAVMTAAAGRLFRTGVLIKSSTAIERLAEVDSVVFDKTGTLTLGQPRVIAPQALDANDLALAAGLAVGSSHPVSRAVVQAAHDCGIRPQPVTDVTELPGCGISGRLDGADVRMGRADWVGADGAQDASGVWLARGGSAPVLISTSDTVRPGAQAAIAALRARGCTVALLSGDAAAPVRDLAEALGIDNWQSGVSPQEKAAHVQALAARGAHVLMVGDGLNDTVALATAHVSAAPASALDAARVASDVVLLGGDLDALPEALETARQAVARVRENFALATIYNLIAVPIALLGFATPLAAAIAMSTSSITVSLNALRVR